ncbi:MAG: class I SAM-dependent methyltransferase [Woeseiaceae bacterium]|nr:class I SAM-dependent methyltransferase [Woeseiaceae bacterium]
MTPRKEAFTAWCRDELFTAELIEAADLMQQALDLHLVSIYEKLGFAELLSEPRSPGDVVDALGYVESADRTIEAVLERLASRFEFVVRSSDGATTQFSHAGEIPASPASLEDIHAAMAKLGDEYVASLEFLAFGEDKFEYALRDDPDFLDKILSGRESEYQELWFRATNTDPLQNVHGIMGAVAIDMLFDRGRILEIGGGTGNGIRNLFKHLAAKSELDRVESFVFTDISQKFIMTTRREIRTDYPDVDTEWRFADLNVALADQKIEPASVDLIYAVNAAHVAKDIVAFLESCRSTLKPGGRVLFAERIRLTPRDMAPRELALNLSIYHRTAAIRNDDYRPMHCYLSPENWVRVFELAGFSNAEVWPDIGALADAFPNQYAAIVTATA